MREGRNDKEGEGKRQWHMWLTNLSGVQYIR